MLSPAVKCLCLYKITFVCIVLWTTGLAPFYDPIAHRELSHWPPGDEPTLASRFATWDAAHYLHLSVHGYQKDDKSCAFYPLWPALIRVAAYATMRDPLIPGLILANLLSLIGLWLFYRLASEVTNMVTANISMLLLLSFPGAMFFSFPYSEPLFFLLIIALFLARRRRNYWLMASLGFLLPLTRAIGVFAVLPLVWHLLERVQEANGRRHSDNLCFVRTGGMLMRSMVNPALPPVLSVLLAYGAYFFIMCWTTGNAFEGFEAQRNYPNQPSIGNIVNVPGFMRAFVTVKGLHGMVDSGLDRLLFLVFLCCLPGVWRLDRAFFWYAIGSGLIPAMSKWFVSYNRFVILCFPVFIVLAERFRTSARPWLLFYTIAVSSVVQLLLLIRFTNFLWAG